MRARDRGERRKGRVREGERLYVKKTKEDNRRNKAEGCGYVVITNELF